MNQRERSLIDEDKEFRRFYARHLKPLEHRYESLRLKAVKETIRRIIAALAAWLAAVGAICYLGPIEDALPFVIFFVLLAALGLALWAWLPARAHSDRLKEDILPRIVSFFGDLRYQAEPNLDPNQYDDWKVLPVFNGTYMEDQIEGSYHGVPLKLAEARLEHEKSRTSRGNTTTTRSVVFEGLMIIFELRQEYTGVTLIRNRGSNMKGQFHLAETLDEVGTGSGFEVFATDDAPGSKLANARFLERLAEVSARFGARQLFASFHANRLVMMIGLKDDYFEMSHRQQTNFAKDAERVRGQLGRIFAIVDLLHLEGVSARDRKDARSLQSPSFPELPEINTEGSYDIGGWGCFIVFLMFAATMSANLWLMGTELSGGALLWWSSFGALLMSLGLFQAIRSVWRRSALTATFGIILLAGALMVLYLNISSDIQGLIRSWLQE